MNPSTFLLFFSLSFCTSIFGMENESGPAENDDNLVCPWQAEEHVPNILELCKNIDALREIKIRDLVFRYCGGIHYATLTAIIPAPYMVDFYKIKQQFYDNDRVECHRLYPFTALTVHPHNCVTLSSEQTGQELTWNYVQQTLQRYNTKHWHDRKEFEKEREQIVNKDTTIKNISHVEEPTEITHRHGALTFYHKSSKDNTVKVTVTCNLMAIINKVKNDQKKSDEFIEQHIKDKKENRMARNQFTLSLVGCATTQCCVTCAITHHCTIQ